MAKNSLEDFDSSNYEAELRALQIELVKVQKSLIANGDQILVILEGRDTAGKDGTIKAITEHLSPRETRVVALGKPSDVELEQWYFQRYIAQLPKRGEFVLFNRSWYNRAGVEMVMGFCSKAQYATFMSTVNPLESILIQSGVTVLKYYLDISKQEQKLRLDSRDQDPLKQSKISLIDQQAQKKWNAYSTYRNAMLVKTSTAEAPWTIVRANNKKQAHLNLIRDLLLRIDYAGKDKKMVAPDQSIAFRWNGKVSALEK
jgi:polyphosphate kinase 2